MAGLSAYSKGRALGLFQPRPKALRDRSAGMKRGERVEVDLMQRAVPCTRTPDGLRALAKDRPIEPAAVERYLAGKFGEALGPAREAMADLAREIRRMAHDAR